MPACLVCGREGGSARLYAYRRAPIEIALEMGPTIKRPGAQSVHEVCSRQLIAWAMKKRIEAAREPVT